MTDQVAIRRRYTRDDIHPWRNAIQWTGVNHSEIVKFFGDYKVTFRGDTIEYDNHSNDYVYRGDWLAWSEDRIPRIVTIKAADFQKSYNIVDQQEKKIRIAVDGPVGSGKSYILQCIAKMLQEQGVPLENMTSRGSEVLDGFEHGDHVKEGLPEHKIAFFELPPTALEMVFPCLS